MENNHGEQQFNTLYCNLNRSCCMSLCSAPSWGLWCAIYSVDKSLFLWLGTEASKRGFSLILTATSVSMCSARAEWEEEPGVSSSVGEGWSYHPQQEVVAAGWQGDARRSHLLALGLVKSIFCLYFLCAVLVQSCLCKAFNKYPLKRGGDEQGNRRIMKCPSASREAVLTSHGESL